MRLQKESEKRERREPKTPLGRIFPAALALEPARLCIHKILGSIMNVPLDK
jgi:hypothetical protein